MASSWERLADITLGTAGDKLDSGTITAKEHLRVEIHTIPTGGTIKEDVTFNNDSGSNYARRRSNDNAAESTNVSRTELEVYGDNTTDRYLILDIINIANKEKLLIGEYHVNTVGVGNAPNRSNWVGKWANTSDQITRIEIDNGEGSGDYAIGSQMTIWGADDQSSEAKDKSSITNVPVGTRYEETDTRKIFRYKDEGYTASIGTDADWTTSSNMTSNNSVTSPTGLGAKSWYSNGSSSYIQMDAAGRESLFPVGADFSMSIWLYFSNIASETTAQNAPIMFPTDGSGVRWENAWRGGSSNFGRMVMDLNDGSNSSNTDSNGYTAHGMLSNTWYLWVYTFNASNGTGTLYKGRYGTDSNVSQYTTSGTSSCTGAPNDPNYKMIGVSSEVLGGDGNARVNDVAIWNKVLSSSEMHDMFNSESGSAGGTAKKAPDVNKTAIRAYWDCQTHAATISNAATGAGWTEKGTA